MFGLTAYSFHKAKLKELRLEQDVKGLIVCSGAKNEYACVSLISTFRHRISFIVTLLLISFSWSKVNRVFASLPFS
jgi:hypothetical protein